MKNVEIPKWLEGLPLAPEFHPTDTEFADPIAYISKIEKEASAFGICKVIPPLPKPSRKYVLHNLNKSLSKCPELGSDVNVVLASKTDTVARDNCDGSANGGEGRAVFTTRHQELGCELGKRMKGPVPDQMLGARKQVWQSGEVYTLEQFEAKSKNFARSQLGTVKEVNPLVIESMFWKAASEKPIYVEYANDVPGTGFGEPEGLLHYFQKRRRRRKRNSFDRNKVGTTSSNNDKVNTENSSVTDKDSGSQNNSNLCTETASNLLPSTKSNQGANSGRKDSDCGREMEGSAGWKLSNSPWNLQVIARSPGSLTRFMPDDIPGVTSPMVYIGMLFSWFAWHVEDHELHSLNFLHMGSPKTWYAVPGDYAYNFEEVICHHAYGGNTDRLHALSLLGEKTTVLSPKVIAASGIPCCRLVQYPGEFVVTFPRAYHIGFSHGFNCGEAANFGTPKWLTVAKEAAVRRAAMNFLPMLSHQQLLYLLTMSFISRIPRSLLPGVRSSRLRDRQKEERELLVKRAFIQDILHENNLLSILLQRNPSYQAVLWDLELLPSSSKESEFRKDVNAAISTSTEKECPMIDDSLDHVRQLNNYISEAGFDLNDDDLAYDFQMDSGTLPCVACGILGFPFMAIIQPSDIASKNLLLGNPLSDPVDSDINLAAEVSTGANKAKSNRKDLCHANEASSVDELSQTTRPPIEQSLVSCHSSSFNHEPSSSKVEITKGWNTSTSFLRPRIFCLEHAIEIEELLNSKGGANVLLICHSDFQKIKAHAAVIAEEIAYRFHYSEIPLASASLEDLNLIDITVDSREQVDCADWTSQLNINIQHYAKVKKSTPSKKFQYLSTLGGLFFGETQIPSASSIKWRSRKVRSKRLAKCQLQDKPYEGIGIMEKDLKTNLKPEMAKKDVKIIQYSRRKYKCPTSARTEAPTISSDLVVRDISGTACHNIAEKGNGASESIPIPFENNGNSYSGSSALASVGKLELQTGFVGHSSPKGPVHYSPQSGCANSLIASAPMIDTAEAESSISPMNEAALEEEAGSPLLKLQTRKVKAGNNSIEKNELPFPENPVGLDLDENCSGGVAEIGYSTEERTTGESVVESKTFTELAESDFEMHQDVESDGIEVTKDVPIPTAASDGSDEGLHPDHDELAESTLNRVVTDSEVSKSSIGEEQEHIQRADNQDSVVSRSPAVINESTSGVIEECAPSEVGSHNDENGNGGVVKKELYVSEPANSKSRSVTKSGSKRKRDIGPETEDQLRGVGFIKSPCEGLRPRARKDVSGSGTDDTKQIEKTPATKRSKKSSDHVASHKDKKGNQKRRYKCDIEGCSMSFQTKAELGLHKGNRCPVEGCRKKFNSHKYAVLHQRVHDDDRPLKCPWKGCTMSFKWAWARTEHLRVHTGERPYACKVKGCGLTFRFVSDFSRHRRKTGHYVNTPPK